MKLGLAKRAELALLLAATLGSWQGMATAPEQTGTLPPQAGASGAPTGPGQGGGRGGRGGGLPGATPEQTQAVAAMNAALTDQIAAVTAARAELTQATFATAKDAAAINRAVETVRIAELALALKRADEFAKLQTGPNKLNAEQVAALIAAAGNTGGRGRGGAPPPAGGVGRGAQ